MKVLVSAFVVVACPCGLMAASELARTQPLPGGAVVTFGRYGDDPAAEAKILAPLLAELGRAAGLELRLHIEPGMSALRQDVARGQLDVFVSPAPVAFGLRARGLADPILIPAEPTGESSYPSLVFVRADSGIRSFGGLQGRIIAFEEHDSAVGFHLPRCTLQGAGLRLEEMNPEALIRPPPGKTGYVFSHAKLNTVSWVFHRKVDAGAASLRTWRNLVERRPAMRDALVEIGRTPAFPRQAISIRRGALSPERAARLKAAFTGLSSSASGRAALAMAGWREVVVLDAARLAQLETLAKSCGGDLTWR